MKKEKTFLIHLNHSDCCGCGTCALVCPKQAITMVPKELGSVYPEVNRELCIGCGLCEKYCAYRQRSANLGREPMSALAATMTDKAELDKSASGGVAAALSKAFIQAGGVVVGCALEYENGILLPRHILVRENADLWKLQGSKYVQSDLGSVFEEIKNCLAEGKGVLFFGTPCQGDSLKRFLKDRNTEKLYIVDLICHGVPSAKLFNEYLKTLKSNVRSFSFRDKTFGWGLTASCTFLKADGKVKKRFLPADISSYYSYFLEGKTYRESCYSCKYTNGDRVGDLTIGDFWGIEQEYPQYLAENGGEFDVKNGISAVLINTKKGQHLLETYGAELLLREAEYSKIARWNRQLFQPTKCSNLRSVLTEYYEESGYKGIEKQFYSRGRARLYYRRVKTEIKRALRIDLWRKK